MANKRRNVELQSKRMSVSRCRVSYTDADGVLHCVDVDSESLYEAVAMAVAEWREDEMIPQMPGPMTELTVTVIRRPVEHKIRLGQVQKWAQPSVVGGPAAIVKRERVRRLLGAET